MAFKQFSLSIIAFLFVSSSVLSENSSYCKVVIYRNNPSTEDGYAYKVLSNNTLLTELKNKNYFTFYMPEGKLNLKAYYVVSAEIDLPIVKNKTSFVRLDVLTENSKQIAKLVVVDSITANKEILSCKTPTVHKRINYNEVLKNQIGLSIGGGWSFTRIPIIVTTQSTDATLGFGGGFNGSIFYTREFSEYFGTDFNLSTQSSGILPGLTNASVNFNRGCLSITPFFIIPINADGEKRIKLGAGLDYYFGANLNFDMAKLKDGFNEKWNYNQPLGYNITGMYEVIFQNNLSVQAGGRFCSVKYKFVSSQGSRIPTDATYGNPSGMGLFFLLGIGYRF